MRKGLLGSHSAAYGWWAEQNAMSTEMGCVFRSSDIGVEARCMDKRRGSFNHQYFSYFVSFWHTKVFVPILAFNFYLISTLKSHLIFVLVAVAGGSGTAMPV